MRICHKTISAFLMKTAKRLPEKTALIQGNFNCTWKELDTVTDYMAYRMHMSGIAKGTHIGIWSVNTPNWVTVYLAAVKIGAVPVLINTCYRERELRDVLDSTDVEFLYYGDVYKDINYPAIVEALKQNGCLKVKRWIFIGKAADGSWITGDSFVGSEKTKRALSLVRGLKREVSPADTVSMLFTSGTTSESKAVMLSHDNLLNSARATVESMQWSGEDQMCIAVPLFHCFGLTSGLLSSMILGSTVCILSYYRTVHVLEAIQRLRCTVLNGVPSMFLAMIKNPDFDSYDLSSLKSGIIAGSPLSEEEYLLICGRIPGIMLLPSYGQTETSPAVTFALPGDSLKERARSVGKAVSGVRIRIADPKTGKGLTAGETGEIQVRGYNLMQGYYRREAETQEAFTADGWLRTGDLGYLDKRKYLHVTGRCKEMIIRAGENISPHEIAGCLLEIPWIESAAVIGMPAEVIQEEIVACIILKPGESLREPEIRSYMEGRIAHYKIPSWFVQMESFPVSTSGKILLRELKQLVAARLNHNS